MRAYYLFFFILFLNFAPSAIGQDGNKQLDFDTLSEKWVKLSSDTLLRMGDRLSTYPVSPDSALLCYSIVEVKEGARNDKAKSAAIVKALLGKAKLYSYTLQNYGEAYECLMRALDLTDKNPSLSEYKPVILLRLASVCHILFEITKDRSLFEEASSKFLESMEYAYSSGNFDEYDLSYLNLLSLCYTANDLEKAARATEYYQPHFKYESDWKRKYNVLLSDGLRSLQEGEDSRAAECFQEQLRLLPAMESTIRYRYLTLACLTESYFKEAQFDKALKAGEESLQLARNYKMTDGELDAMRMLGKIWEAKGNNEEKTYWKELEISLKDSLLSNANSSGLGNIRFNYDLKKVAGKLQQSERKRQGLIIVVILVLVVLSIVGLMLRSIIIKNKRLKLANQRLFEDYQQKIEAIRKESRRSQEEEKNIQNAVLLTVEDQSTDLNSEMMDEETEQTYGMVRQAVEDSELIYQTDFSLNMLASLMKLSSAKISRAINRHENMNFPSFINRYRVMKACSMFEDSQFATLTIETIAQNVGFKSRAAFIAAFKKETALTPSEYLKALKNK